MKTKYTLYSLALAAASLTACSESSFLDTPPQGVISEAVLNSSDGVNLLINAAYAALMGPSPQDNSVWLTPTSNWSYGEVRSDNAYKGGGGTGDCYDIHRLEDYTVDATNGNLDGKWFQLYVSVKRCNSALRVLNDCTAEQVPNLEILKAEMKALRAHFYFELSRMFNQIVWIEEDVAEADYSTIPNNQYTRDQILQKIATDLENAANVLPATQSELGRVNKYMAKAYAAKVYLYKAYQQNEADHSVTGVNASDMQKVITLTDEVITSNKYDLLDDFQKLDLVQYENGKESVWAIQYSMNDGSGSAGRVNWSNLLNAPQGPYSGDGFFLPSQDLINAYQTDANGLPLLDGSFQGKNFDVIVEKDGEFTNTQCDHTVDPRLDFIIGRPNVTWKTYETTPCLASWVRNRGDYGFHCSKRFFVSPESPDMFNGWPWGASQLNWQIIRYADVLLWKAEALIETDQQELARPLINQIRRRAKNSEYVKAFPGQGPNYNGYAANYKIEEYPAAGWTQDYARQALRFETRLETAMEGERMYDLVRWGIAEQTMNKYFAAEKDARIYYKTSKFQKGRDEYYPISTNQYKFSNNTYVQNPGYSF